MDREIKKKTVLDELNESWQKYMKKRMGERVFSPVVETYPISEKQKKQIDSWKKKLNKIKSLRDVRYTEWYMFSGSSGIGLAVKIRREYYNGVIEEIDVTDVSEW